MPSDAPESITGLLLKWSDGDPDALERLMPLVYDELRRLAVRYLRRERANHTLQPTALIYEAYMRLVDQQEVEWQGRETNPQIELIAVHEALERLATFDPQKAQIVELRFFGGLSIEETAEVLCVGHATVERDWKLAKAWLRRELE